MAKACNEPKDAEEQRQHYHRTHQGQNDVQGALPAGGFVDFCRFEHIVTHPLPACEEKRHVETEILPDHHQKQRCSGPTFVGQHLMKSIVSLGASFVTSQPSRLANRSLALPLPPLTSGKKTHPSFSSGSPFLSAALARPSTKSQLPIR